MQQSVLEQTPEWMQMQVLNWVWKVAEALVQESCLVSKPHPLGWRLRMVPEWLMVMVYPGTESPEALLVCRRYSRT